MDYSDFKKLKAFFKALQEGRFRSPKENSATILIEGERTPVDKAECLELLRERFPSLKDKDDNSLIKYLLDPGNRKRVVGNFTLEQQKELEKALQRPVITEEVSTHIGGQEAPVLTGQETQPGKAIDTSFGGTTSSSTPSYRPGRVIHNIPHAPPKGEVPQEKIYPANKGGVVTGEHIVGASTPQGFKTETPKIAIANKSGVVAETPPSKIYVANKSGVVVGERSIAPAAVKSFGLNMGSATQIGIKRASTRLGSAFSNFLGGAGRGGRGLLGLAVGGGGNAVLKLGSKSFNFGANALSKLSASSPQSISAFGTKRAWVAGLLMGFGLVFLVGVIIPGLSPEQQQVAQALPLVGGDISSCQFTRGAANPPSASYRSSALLNYFQEVSAKTTVPSSVLAGIARVETPSSVNWTNDTVTSKSSAICPVSPDGALGIMQIIPQFSHRTDAFCRDCVQNGAKYLGKTVDQLTKDDYCDPRVSIYLGAGFILKKLQALGYGDGTKWDPNWTNNKDVIYKAAQGFYGCLAYGGPDRNKCEGPYNYGEDVWTSVSQCKVSTTTSVIANASCPIPDGKISCGSYDGVSGKVNPCHCIPSYRDSNPALCTTLTKDSNLVRTAKAIDITPGNRMGVAGDKVYLPSIQGQPVKWRFVKNDVDKKGYGGLRLFQTDPTSQGVWSLYFIHVDTANPPLDSSPTKRYDSGDEAARIGTGFDHAHVNIGLDIKNFGGDDFFDPGWKFPDKDLSMCVK